MTETLQQRAVVAIGQGGRDQELIALAASTTDITAITNEAGFQQVKRCRIVLKGERCAIQKAGKAARDDATKYRAAVIAEEDRLVALVSGEEARLESLEGGWEAEIEREREARIAAEQKRVSDLQIRVNALSLPNFSTDTDPAVILNHIETVSAIKADDSFEEFQQQALQTKADTLIGLSVLHEASVKRIAEKVELETLRLQAAEREAQDAQAKKDLRAKEAEEARLATARATEERVKAESEATAKADAERKAIATLKARQDKHDAALDNIRRISKLVEVATLGSSAHKARSTEATDRIIADLEALPIGIDCYGDLFESAVINREMTLERLRERREKFADEERIAREIAAAEQVKRDEEAKAAEAKARGDEERNKAAKVKAAYHAIMNASADDLSEVLARHYGCTTTHALERLLQFDQQMRATA